MDQIYLPNLKNKDDLKKLLTNFFDGNKLDKEKLRLFILDNLNETKKQLNEILFQAEQISFWDKIQDLATISNDYNQKIAISQIRLLPKTIDDWIKESVASKESFEFFILSKAAELSSGDKIKDYFYALKIRNDQLLAFLFVCTESLNNINICYQKAASEVLNLKEYRYFGEKEIKTRVFEIAEKLYQERVKIGELN